MRASLLMAFAVAASLPVSAQSVPDCAALLTEQEIRSTCGVPEAVVAVSQGSDSCQITAQRDGTASMLRVTLALQDNAEAAQMSVEVARSLGQASDDSRGSAGNTSEAEQALGQVLQMLDVQDSDAAEAQDVSDAEAARKDLPALGDGGVRYVSDAASGMGLVTHTIVFSSGATLVTMESGVIAGRAGVCTVETLEPLAQLVSDRL
ncbi:MAG: hypothetical protein AAF170_14970 [Bacteroidota bacterium]